MSSSIKSKKSAFTTCSDVEASQRKLSINKSNDIVVPQATGDLDAVYGVGGVGRTQRRLKARHVTFIGFGGGIGTGLFIATGSALATSGPAGLLLANIIVGGLLWCVMESIGEMATLFPTAGSFPHIATRFIDPALGFTLAISYGYCYTIAIGSEMTAAAIIVSYWTDMTPAVVITVGLVAILIINMCSVRFYGEVEVLSASIKIICFLFLVVISLVITLGGTPKGERIAFKYWKDPGPFKEFNGVKGGMGHFLGVFSSFITASFSFIGVETVVVAAAETLNPHKTIPKAVKRVTYRICFFYVLGTLLISMIVSSNDPALLGSSGDGNSSPFVIAIKNSGIQVLPSIINACILISAWSAGNSYCYVGARMVIAMAVDHQAPQFFSQVNRWGAPYYAVLASFMFGPLAYMGLGSSGTVQALLWLQDMSSLAGLLAWMTLCICFIQYERACRAQGIDRNLLPYKGRFQPYSAYIGAIGSAIIVLFSGFKVFMPGSWSTAGFLSNYLGIIIYIVPYILWKLIKKTKMILASEADLFSGRFNSTNAPIEPTPTTWWGKFVDWLI